MIEIFEGRLGGGKTTAATIRILDHLRKGGFVCTNVDLLWDGCLKYCRERWGVLLEERQLKILTEEEICEFYKFCPRGGSLPVLVVLDEAHLWFNARDHATTDKFFRHTLSFLTQSRKLQTDIIFISQSALNLDRQFARLIQYVWRFRDMSRYRVPGLGIKLPFYSNKFLAVQYDYDGKTQFEKYWRTKDPKVFSCFQTNAILRPFPGADTGRVDQITLQRVAKKPLIEQLWVKPSIAFVLAFALFYLRFNFLNY